MAIRSIRKRNRPTFKDQGESFGKAFDKSLSAIDPKVADKKEKVEKTPQIEEGDDNQASGTSKVSTEEANTNFLKSMDINTINQNRRTDAHNRANEEFKEITTFNDWRYLRGAATPLTKKEKAMKRGFDAANELAKKY